MGSIPRIPIEDSETTPIDAPTPIRELSNEVRLLRLQTARVADYAMNELHIVQSKTIPDLEKRIARVQLFHQWFPTIAIVMAIVVRLIWLR